MLIHAHPHAFGGSKVFWLAALSSLSVSSIFAKTDVADGIQLDPIVITATRTEQPLSQVLADVSVIEQEEIERAGASTVADVLERLPGVQFNRSGGQGADTSVFVSGAESRLTAVFIDGVRIDSQAFSGGANWQNLPLAQIERIEVLRGPAASVYGSDAVAGVIQIFTRKGEAGLQPSISFGAGSYQTRKSDAHLSGTHQAWDYSLSVSRQASQGFSARINTPYNQDDDGYAQTAYSGKLGLKIDASQHLELTLLRSNLKAQYDSGNQPQLNHQALYGLQTAGLNWQAHWDEAHTSQVSISKSQDSDLTLPHDVSDITTLSQRSNLLAQHSFKLGAHRFTGLLEQRFEQIELVNVLNTTTAQRGFALGYGYAAKKHTLQANARHDAQSQFGSKNTGSLAYGYALNPQWRLSSSVATSFRLPSLYVRYAPRVGNPDLQPETGLNKEVGLRYTQGPSGMGLVVYQNRLSHLFQSVAGHYESTAKVQLQGASLSGHTQHRGVNLRFSWDVQNPVDLNTHKTLAWRARHFGNVGFDTQSAGWIWGAELRGVGQRFNASASTRAAGYGLLHVFANKQLNSDWHLQARIDNLLDHHYLITPSFGTPARSAFIGLRWAPQAI